MKRVLLSVSLLLVLSPWARAASLCTGTPADYVIVTPASWISSFDAYVATKTAQGVATRVFSLEDIIANYAGADTQEKIRAFSAHNKSFLAINQKIITLIFGRSGGAEKIRPAPGFGQAFRSK